MPNPGSTRRSVDPVRVFAHHARGSGEHRWAHRGWMANGRRGRSSCDRAHPIDPWAQRARGSTTPGRPKEGGMTVRRTGAARGRGIGGSVGSACDGRSRNGSDSARGGGLWVGSGRRRYGRASAGGPTVADLLPTAGTVSGHDTNDATTRRRNHLQPAQQRNSAKVQPYDDATTQRLVNVPTRPRATAQNAAQPRGDPERSGQRPFHGSRFDVGWALRGRVPNAWRRAPIRLNVTSMRPP